MSWCVETQKKASLQPKVRVKGERKGNEKNDTRILILKKHMQKA